MEIKIPLPQNISANTYQELRGYLKQLELAIHHAQKAVDNAYETGIQITEDASVRFEHPSMPDEVEFTEDFRSEYYSELQDIALVISLS